VSDGTSETRASESSVIKLSSEELDSARRVREAVEKDLIWKYGLLATIVGITVGGGAVLGYQGVTREAQDFFDIARTRSEEINKQISDIGADFRRERAALQSQHDTEIEQLKDQERILNETTQRIGDAKGQVDSVLEAVSNANKGLAAAAAVINSLPLSTLSPEAKQQVQIVSEAAARSEILSQNSRFTVFPHYRRDTQDFLPILRNILSGQGFVVASASLDSDVSSVKGYGGRINEGPHVSYFLDVTKSAEEQRSIADAARRAVDALNASLPSGWSPFQTKAHTDQGTARQTSFLGVWF
jgi:hypothetical protein